MLHLANIRYNTTAAIAMFFATFQARNGIFWRVHCAISEQNLSNLSQEDEDEVMPKHETHTAIEYNIYFETVCSTKIRK